MSITNFFEAESLIIKSCRDLFSPNMIYKHSEVGDLDNDDFTKFTIDSDKVGLMVMQAGFKVNPMVGKRSFKQQKIKFFWRLAIVCPSDLYDTIGGLKKWEVMQRLMGTKLSPNYTELVLIDDERDFNEPEFMRDFSYQPIMFQCEGLLNGE